MFAASWLAFCLGLITISQQVLWIRLFGFANNNLPQAFAFVVMMYLLGIAGGAFIGRIVATRFNNLWKCCGYVLMAASVFDLTAPWLFAYFGEVTDEIVMGGILILIMAGTKGIIFPLAHHLGVPAIGPGVGRLVSRVYCANILGATLGPFFTSMILLSAMTTQDCFSVCAELLFLISLFCLRDEFKPAMWAFCSVIAVLILGFIVKQENTEMMGLVAEPRGDIAKIVETRQGVIVVYKGLQGDDIIFSDNVYVGRTNLDPVINSNNINRILVLAALNDKPEEVLLIGLSSGTWLKLIASFPAVKNIDVLETNPGFLSVIKDYPQLQTAINDPRVHIHYDDSRRWLRKHASNKYDLIVMNTSFSWRLNASNLLSRDFLLTLKQHLQEGGILAYNSFGSEHVFKTAQTVFSCVHMYENFVIAGDFDWRKKLHSPDAIKKLAAISYAGKTVFPAGSEVLIKTFLNENSSDFIDMDVRTPTGVIHIRPKVITDDNVLPEYRYGKELGSKLF